MSEVNIKIVEDELTDNYDIDQSQIESIKENTEEAASDVFDRYGVELTTDALKLIQRRLLERVLEDIRRIQEKEVGKSSFLDPENPEGHIERLQREMEEQAGAAESNIGVVAGGLSTEVSADHPITQLTEAYMAEKYD